MNRWNDRYSRGDNLSAEPHPLVVEFGAKLSPGRALDLACGVGRNAISLAALGWQVTAVDASRVAGEILLQRAQDAGVTVDFVLADLDAHQFEIEEEGWDLIVVCFYLQRDLFPVIRKGLKPGGVVITVIALIDDDPEARPMNPDFLLRPAELRAQFEGLELLHDFEGKKPESGHKRAVAEIVARKRMVL